MAGKREPPHIVTLPSYVHGISNHALIGETIGRYFDAICEQHAHRIAVVARHQHARVTYQKLQEQVDAVACSLLRLGLEPGDRIGIWSTSRLEWVVTQFAAAKAGLILVNINPAYRTRELEYALNRSGCKALVVLPHFKTTRYLDMLEELAPELAAAKPGQLRSAALPSLRAVIQLGPDRIAGMLHYGDLLDNPKQEERARLAILGRLVQFDDPANIQFTSGTTGSPKGVTLSHHNILNNAYFVSGAIKLEAGDRLCIPVPLYHCFGMVMGNLGCLTRAATMVFPAEAFDPLACLQAVDDERCTALYGVPTMFIAMLDHPEFHRFELTSLRTGIMAGSPCPVEIMRRVIDRMHMRDVTIAYGMTETSPVSFQSRTDDPIARRISTVGRIGAHCEVKIVDERGRIVPRGTRGELCTRGYSVMLGYWNEKQATHSVIDDAGWMHTGDLAVLDEEGYCAIVGRAKDMVIRGGENISPREIEEFLHEHPDIGDVQVIGVPDEKYGEELCACIIVRKGATLEADDVRRFCAGRIAHYKIPRYVKFVEAFPLTVTGKVQKYLIRERVARELNSASK